MNNYKLVKNTEWKEVEINGEMKDIPSYWEVFTLKNFGFVKTSSVDKKIKEGEQIVDLFNYMDVYRSTTKLVDSNIKFTKTSIKPHVLEENHIKKGDVFFTPSSETEDDIGYSATAVEDIPNAVYSYHLVRFRPTKKILDEKFSGKIFNTKFCRDYFTEKCNGLTRMTLKKGDFEDLQIYFPTSLSEQNNIYSVINNQESIIQDIESLISKYESRFQYLSDELLSGRLRVKEVDGQTVLYKNPEDNWKEVEINGEMKEIPKDWNHSTPKKLGFNIKTGKKDANAAKEDGKYPFFTCSSNEVFKIDTYVFDTEALLISGNGSTLGEVRYYKGKFDAYQRTYVIDNIKNIFYYDLYFKKYFRDSLNIIGGSIPFIKLGHIEDFDILIPKEDEFFLIVSILTQQNELINTQKQLLSEEKQKFDWLLDNLLSGKYLIKE